MTGLGTQPASDGDPSIGRELLGAVATAAVFVIVDRVHFVEGRSLLSHVSTGARSAFYISISASCAALLGFAITATSILLVLGSGPRMTWLRDQREFQKTRVVFMYAIYALALATAVFTALIVIDTGQVGAWSVEALGAGVLALVVTRLAWVLWLLDQLLRISLDDRRQSSEPIAPAPFDEPLDDPR
ncbi:MAG TPA: hypothetical protein VN618_08905 [Solirubrobacteraceae bacterium]|nr:hypothetical protein [Solirubrobacteraceae bacterium]